jgi:hypothetical protein
MCAANGVKSREPPMLQSPRLIALKSSIQRRLFLLEDLIWTCAAGTGSILSSRCGRADSKFKHDAMLCVLITFCTSKMIHRILCAASWIVLMQIVPGTLALPGIERFLYLMHSRNATMFNEMPRDTGIERRVIADQPILTFLDICNNVSFLELCSRQSVTNDMLFAGNRAGLTVQYRMFL